MQCIVFVCFEYLTSRLESSTGTLPVGNLFQCHAILVEGHLAFVNKIESICIHKV